MRGDAGRLAPREGRRDRQRGGAAGRGRRAFSAGLDVTEAFGQPDDVWNHEDPGEYLSAKWQQVWKPVVCAVQGICTAGALYFLNEADVVICSDDATFFDSHVTFGLVSAIEPVGLMRRVGLGETLRMALMGNDERVTADDRACASGSSPRWWRGPTCGTGPTRSRGRSRRSPRPRPRARCAAIWESLDKPYRAAMEQGLLYTRLGNPIGMAEVDRATLPQVGPSPAMNPLSERIDAVLSIDPEAPALEFEQRWYSWGDLRHTAEEVADALARSGSGPAPGWGCCCATDRCRSASRSACCGPRRAWSP